MFYEISKNAIMSEIETKDTQKILDKIQNSKSTEKALADFRKLLVPEKYKECVYYGNRIAYVDIKTTDGWLTLKTFEIYGVKFLFILLSGKKVINCYELQ